MSDPNGYPERAESDLNSTPDLVLRVTQKLIAHGYTIAFGESATGGSLARAFSLVNGAGEVLQGGIVCYSSEVKERLLGVPPELLEACTAESAEVTRQVAFGVKKQIDADMIVAVTGLVRPGGSESEKKQVGTIFLAALFQNKCYEKEIRLDGTPEGVIDFAIVTACYFVSGILDSKC